MTDFTDLVPRPDRPLRRHRPALYARPMSSGCAARCRSSTASPGAAPTGCGSCSTTRTIVNALGAVTGNQAMQMVRAGLKAIYLSGWQVAADANTAGAMYPDQSLYPANAGPELCRRINRTLQRADQIEHMEGGAQRDWFAPIVADAEAGFGGPLNCFEIMKAYIEAGAAGRPFRGPARRREEVRPSGRQGADPDPGARSATSTRRGSPPTSWACRPCWSPAPTRRARKLITSDVDERDREFLDRRAHARGLLPAEGRHRPRSLHQARPGLRRACRPALVGDLAPRISTTRAASPRRSMPAIPASCWPTTARPASTGRPSSTRTRSPTSSASSARWATSSSSSPWPASTASTTACSSWRAATATAAWRPIPSCSRPSSPARRHGYTATRHQREVGTGYFDQVAQTLAGGDSSTTALAESTEADQFTRQAA